MVGECGNSLYDMSLDRRLFIISCCIRIIISCQYMISNLIVGIHDASISSHIRLLNTISYVHSLVGDNTFGGGRNI
jgi:hypothetical protein